MPHSANNSSACMHLIMRRLTSSVCTYTGLCNLCCAWMLATLLACAGLLWAWQLLHRARAMILYRRMTRALQTFEIKPAYEDLATPGATSLQAYLKRVHEMNVLAAMQVGLGLRSRAAGIDISQRW